MTAGFWSGAGAAVLSSALSYLGNNVTSAVNSGRAWKYTRLAQLHQDELNRKFVKDYYGLNRQSLVNAGYNPLLAVPGSSAQQAIYSGSGLNSDSDNGSQALSSALDALRLRNENKLNKSQIKLNQSQEDLNTQNTYKTFADELKSRAEANVASATEAKIYNDINWDNIIKDAEFKQIIANTKYTNERSRGYSASSSRSYSGGLGAKGIGANGSYTQSDSKSW